MSSVDPLQASLPCEISTQKKSVRLAKQLLSMAVSTIAYLRFNIPEEDFARTDALGVPVMVLKQKANSEQGKNIMTILKDAFNLLDKDYIRDLRLCIHADGPDEVVEMYTFTFDKNDSGSTTVGNVQTQEELITAMRPMMKKLIVVTQDLNPLPEEAYFCVKFTAIRNAIAPMGEIPSFRKVNSEAVTNLENSAKELQNFKFGSIRTCWLKISSQIHSSCAAEGFEYLSQMSQDCSQKNESPSDSPVRKVRLGRKRQKI